MAAGGKPVESDFERALKAGGKEPEGPSVLDRVKRGVGIAATGVSNALDTATGGAYRFVRDQLPAAARNIASGDAHRILFGNPEEKPSEAAQYEQQVNEAHPLYANVTSDLGYLVPGGAPVRAAEAATAGVEALAARVPKVISRVLRARPVAGAAVSGVVTGGSQVAQDVASGAPLDADLAKRAGRATAIGAALGGGAGTIGAAGSATARAIRNPKNLIGRTIRDVEAAGGRISATGNPTRGGIYETPEMQALPEGREGNNQLAYQEGQRITAHNEAKLANARSEYGKELSDRLSANGDSNHFVVDTHQLLDRLADENTVNGVVGDQHLSVHRPLRWLVAAAARRRRR